MIKFLLSSIFLFSFNAMADKSLCGKAVGFAFNQDTIERAYMMSGFFVKQNTSDIRVTFGNSPELITDIETLTNFRGVFVCLDKYELKKKTYSGKARVYGVVSEYRVWQNGEPVLTSAE